MFDTTDETWWTELATRESHGIAVRLFWSRSRDLLMVAVSDAGNGDYFELVLEKDEQALDVFHHPYAHAAARGIEFGAARPEPEVMLDAA